MIKLIVLFGLLNIQIQNLLVENAVDLQQNNRKN